MIYEWLSRVSGDRDNDGIDCESTNNPNGYIPSAPVEPPVETSTCSADAETWSGLKVCDERPRDGYDRDAFGTSYSSLEDEIIAALPPTMKANGQVYTGLTGTFYTSGNEREPLERKESDMTKKRHTPEQIVTLLRQVEVAVANGKGTPQACKEAAITEQTYYRWRKEYGGLKLAQAKRLKELEKENSRLKHVVAELSLEKQILREVAQGNS